MAARNGSGAASLEPAPGEACYLVRQRLMTPLVARKVSRSQSLILMATLASIND